MQILFFFVLKTILLSLKAINKTNLMKNKKEMALIIVNFQ